MENVDNIFHDEEVPGSACARLGTTLKQKTSSPKVECAFGAMSSGWPKMRTSASLLKLLDSLDKK